MNNYEMILVFEAKQCNPNGDPSNDNNVRTVDVGNEVFGVVTDTCIKRKIRRYANLCLDKDIFFGDSDCGNNLLVPQVAEVCDNNKTENKVNTSQALADLLKNKWDIRAFGAALGAVKTPDKTRLNSVRGPVTVSMGRTIHPITTNDYEGVRTSANDAKETDTHIGKFCSWQHLDYGLFRQTFGITSLWADKTGFNEDDFIVLLESMLNMFSIDAARARPKGSMVVKHLYVFACPDNKHLLDLDSLVKFDVKKDNVSNYNDVDITTNAPDGVHCYDVAIPEEMAKLETMLKG